MNRLSESDLSEPFLSYFVDQYNKAWKLIILAEDDLQDVLSIGESGYLSLYSHGFIWRAFNRAVDSLLLRLRSITSHHSNNDPNSMFLLLNKLEDRKNWSNTSNYDSVMSCVKNSQSQTQNIRSRVKTLRHDRAHAANPPPEKVYVTIKELQFLFEEIKKIFFTIHWNTHGTNLVDPALVSADHVLKTILKSDPSIMGCDDPLHRGFLRDDEINALNKSRKYLGMPPV